VNTKAGELKEYGEKRDFSRTKEPPPAKKPGRGPLTFVIQKHRARALHYDFRIEADGVLKSWSVPKGPSLNPQDKRLAVMVEDHPLDYTAFEGQIPRGEYGAGEVIVWDRGTYAPEDESRAAFEDRAEAEHAVLQGLKDGKLSLQMRGEKLKGSFALVKLRQGDRNWLLIKHKDDYAADRDVLQEDRSVLSGRTIEDVKAGKPAIADPPPVKLADIPGARRAPFPGKIAPMLATLVDKPFSQDGWIFEPKLDGYRILAYVRNGKATLLSRRGNDVTANYAVLVPDLAGQKVSEMVLDGEIIAMDEKGKPCFQCLQDYLRTMQVKKAGVSEAQYPLVYYVFDLLYMDGYDLRGASLEDRKKLLHGTLRPTGQVRLVDYFERDGETVFRAAVDNGLEGMVAKRLDSKYESVRSKSWLKIKAMKSDEFVIGGYTAGEGNRADTFGSLALGFYNDKGKLVYAGNVGSGFDERQLTELRHRLDSLRTDKSPFDTPLPPGAPVVWVKPELVAEVKFSEWTREGILRIPVFLRLRDDKSLEEVKPVDTMKVPASASKPVKSADPPPLEAGILEQLAGKKDSVIIKLGQDSIKLTNLNKALWPATGERAALTKRDLIVYLAQVAPHLLTHLKDRPVTLSRYPDGIDGEHFWQKHWNHPLPDYVERVDVHSEEDGSFSEYMLCNNLPTLLWMGQSANIEFHTWFSRVSPLESREKQGNLKAGTPDERLGYPDFIIFDLDPYLYSGKEKAGAEPDLNRKGFDRVCEVALWLKEILDSLKLNAYVKTSGKTGLHVHVPVVRWPGYRAVRSAAQTIGRALVEKHPEAITMDWAVEKRTGKVFFDYNQNVRGKTLACAYSPRPAPEATVSTPLRWEELGRVYPTDFTLLNVPERLEKTGDLWADILTSKSDLKIILGE
jgi:bifunctional non-homologous end joining protein LigD